MDHAMNRLCTICARGGSKGVTGKNIRQIAGRPLIAYSIEQARSTRIFDLLAVSSDSDEILDIARIYGADILIKRPSELATDQAAKLPVIQHCAAEVERLSGKTFSTFVDLDATSPLRTPEDIKNTVALLENSDADNVLTAMPSRRSPYFNLVELDNNGIVRLSKSINSTIVRRQDAPKCYDMNASIYVWRRRALLESNSIFNTNTRLYVMPEERSIDIDSELDFRFVEYLIVTAKIA